MTPVGVLGTGLLGSAIATRLLEQGLDVHIWNRDPSRLVPLVKKGATAINDLSQAAQNNRTLITVLRDGATTASVISAVGALQDSTVIPMGTMGVEESRKLALQVADQGGRYLEAPVLGSRPQALSGTLLVMAGGESDAFTQQQELLKHVAEQPLHVGPVGSGSATKLALNQMIASLTHSFSLSLHLIQQNGVSVETFLKILRPSALYAPTFDKKLQRMLDHHYGDPNFSTALLRKDLRLFLEEATTAGLQNHGLSGLLALLEQAQGTELDDQDYCALHELTILK
ncbi:3-hydroxyacid dehydrogenase [Synechococcus sp. KORDI-52]|uniref:NAD(P)-dependent oxidoreductase n=1 Tax=Synechococcus sp. KORDI-52 TaxID=585425 RepID=UPI0004E06804|nr:NAD(P)-dependent oxidoreductase [Synechococcus sp. KORDI-52]AII48119.1 3-hydroxyacid dehydrogenase [Synechococcus sp. KORDI-52]